MDVLKDGKWHDREGVITKSVARALRYARTVDPVRTPMEVFILETSVRRVVINRLAKWRTYELPAVEEKIDSTGRRWVRYLGPITERTKRNEKATGKPVKLSDPVSVAVKAVLADGHWYDLEEAITEGMRRVPPMLAMEHARKPKGVERVKPISDAQLIRIGARNLVSNRINDWRRKKGWVEVKVDGDGRKWVRYLGPAPKLPKALPNSILFTGDNHREVGEWIESHRNGHGVLTGDVFPGSGLNPGDWLVYDPKGERTFHAVPGGTPA